MDVTYSSGKFYEQSKKFYVPQPKIKMDVLPQYDDVIQIQPLEQLNIKGNSISSIVIDLPFIVAPEPITNKDNSNIIFKRFNSFYPKEEMFKTYYHYINEAFRVLQADGICVVKCQATVSCSTQLFLPEFVWVVAQQCGFYVLDQFFLIAKNRLHSGKIQKQQHARKYSSTFWVFKKCDKKVDYFD